MSSEMARRVVARILTAADITVHDVDFASGQEPDDSVEAGEDFATLVRVEFTISGRTLARLLGKQERVLEKALTDISDRKVLNAIQNNNDVLRAITPAVKRMVTQYITHDLGADAPRLSVDFADESDLPYEVKADPRKLAVRVEMEFDVLSS
jgi:hypothetical protein